MQPSGFQYHVPPTGQAYPSSPAPTTDLPRDVILSRLRLIATTTEKAFAQNEDKSLDEKVESFNKVVNASQQILNGISASANAFQDQEVQEAKKAAEDGIQFLNECVANLTQAPQPAPSQNRTVPPQPLGQAYPQSPAPTIVSHSVTTLADRVGILQNLKKISTVTQEAIRRIESFDPKKRGQARDTAQKIINSAQNSLNQISASLNAFQNDEEILQAKNDATARIQQLEREVVLLTSPPISREVTLQRLQTIQDTVEAAIVDDIDTESADDKGKRYDKVIADAQQSFKEVFASANAFQDQEMQGAVLAVETGIKLLKEIAVNLSFEGIQLVREGNNKRIDELKAELTALKGELKANPSEVNEHLALEKFRSLYTCVLKTMLIQAGIIEDLFERKYCDIKTKNEHALKTAKIAQDELENLDPLISGFKTLISSQILTHITDVGNALQKEINRVQAENISPWIVDPDWIGGSQK